MLQNLENDSSPNSEVTWELPGSVLRDYSVWEGLCFFYSYFSPFSLPTEVDGAVGSPASTALKGEVTGGRTEDVPYTTPCF